ncbi:MAG: small-conductance mechanosensitive channel [Aureispira sp.]|jgi:small-conductance mechanosensitive channel
MLSLENIPVSDIFKFLVTGLIIALAFNIINSYIIPFIKERQAATIKWWQRIQITIWLLFVTLFYVRMLQANIIVTVILSVLLFGIGFDYWRNVFAGILIKFSNQFRAGDIISADFAQGQLSAIHLSQTKLINDKGELVVIPNAKIRTAVLKQLYKKNNVQTHSFKVQVATDQSVEDLHRLVLNCPYISANQEINVEKKSNEEYLVQVSVIDNSFVDKVTRYFEGGLTGVGV